MHTHTHTYTQHAYIWAHFPHHDEAMSMLLNIHTYPHHQCPLVTAVKVVMTVKGSLPWRSWVMLRDCWEGGVLRETQSRER